MNARARDVTRVAYLVSHPIQYQAPLLRRIAALDGIELEVFFLSDYSARPHVDPGFGRAIEWDVPVLDGYANRALTSVDLVRTRSPFLRDVWDRIDGDRFDVLWMHGWSQATQLVALRAAHRRGVPVLLRGESKDEPRGRLKRSALRALFARANGFLAIGSENRAFFESVGVDPARIYSMPYSVDVAFFRERAEAAQSWTGVLRTHLGIRPERPVILFASKLIERKRPFDLLEAYRRLSPDGRTEPDAQLVFAGDGALRFELERRIRDIGWSSISTVGFLNQTELPVYYALADAFVLPSEYETWGLVVNEAMCAATPVIATTSVGSAADLIVPGETGFTYAPGDVDALARHLHTLTSDGERARRMGAAALEHVSAYDLDASCDGFVRAVEEVRAA